jgi:SAM-dependent methyltransferase
VKSNHIAIHRRAEGICSHARIEERNVALSLLNILPRSIVCDVPSWGGYAARGIHDPSRVICLDGSISMTECPGAKLIQSSPARHSLPNSSVDRIISLVGMHHNHNPQNFINESFRILKKDGIAVMSEVEHGSSVADFLNIKVDKMSRNGHKGIFLKSGDMSAMMIKSGFSSVSEKIHNLDWIFSSLDQAIKYFKYLFDLCKSSEEEIYSAISALISYRKEEIRVNWPLMYCVGSKYENK